MFLIKNWWKNFNLIKFSFCLFIRSIVRCFLFYFLTVQMKNYMYYADGKSKIKVWVIEESLVVEVGYKPFFSSSVALVVVVLKEEGIEEENERTRKRERNFFLFFFATRIKSVAIGNRQKKKINPNTVV